MLWLYLNKICITNYLQSMPNEKIGTFVIFEKIQLQWQSFLFLWRRFSILGWYGTFPVLWRTYEIHNNYTINTHYNTRKYNFMNVFFPKIANKHGSAMSLSVNYESVSQESCWGFQYFYLSKNFLNVFIQEMFYI